MSNSDVLRLVMVATSSWRWLPAQEMCRRHERLLNRLLLDPTLPGAGSLRCVNVTNRRLWWRSEHLVATDTPTKLTGSWSPPHSSDSVRFLVDDLRQMNVELLRDSDDIDDRALQAFRHRIHLDRERFCAMVGDQAENVPFEACLDIRFRRALGELTCQVGLSLWSHSPWSGQHRPGEGTLHVGDPLDVGRYSQAFEGHSAALVRWLQGPMEFAEQRLRVFSRPYRPPVFWLVVPRGAETIPAADYLKPQYGPLLSHVTRKLLNADDVHEQDIARSVVRGELLVARHFVANDLDDVPRYLLVAGQPEDQPAPPRWSRSRDRWLHDHLPVQENRTRRLVADLTVLESEAATQLFDIQTDLEILDNHVAVFERAVERAGALWDGMAAHLLHHRGRQLAKVHRSVELVHQTLLQGVADVDALLTAAEGKLAAVEEVSDVLRRELSGTLPEAPVPDAPRLVEAISRDGLFSLVSRRSGEISGKAARVAQNYRDLIQAVSDAFDERRVRETDVLQRTTFFVGLFVGLVGLVTVLDTTLELQIAADVLKGGQDWWTRGYLYRNTVWGIGAALIVGLVSGAIRLSGLGLLGSWSYRRTYRAVWKVLRCCSTDHLGRVAERFNRDHYAPPAEGVRGLDELAELLLAGRRSAAGRWNELDHELASRYAQVWDRVTGLRGDVRQPVVRTLHARVGDLTRPYRRSTRAIREDRDNLARMIEKWSLRTFLITERPRELWKLNLPRLTLLYTGALRSLGVGHHVVSRMDFYFLFAGSEHEFTYAEAMALYDWLDREINVLRESPTADGLPRQVSMTRLLESIEERIGVTGFMRDSRKDIMSRVGTMSCVRQDIEVVDADRSTGPGTSAAAGRTPHPVAYFPVDDRWVVTGYRAVEAVLTSRAFSPAESGRPLQPLCEEAREALAGLPAGPLLTAIDPDNPRVHRRERRRAELVLQYAAGRRPRTTLRRAVEERVESIRPTGTTDLMESVLRPVPLHTFGAVLGFTGDETEGLAAHAASARRLFTVPLGDEEQKWAAVDLVTLRARLTGLASRTPDLIRAGRRPEETVTLLSHLLLMGPEAVTALLGNSVWHLLHSRMWGRWRAITPDRDKLADECLRMATPVRFWYRDAVRAEAVGADGANGSRPRGAMPPRTVVPISARLRVDIAAANRDPAVFADGAAFRIHQHSGRHLTFGRGAHACPAQALVRLYLRTTLDVLSEQLHWLALVPDQPPAMTDDGMLHGPKTLPVRWRA